MILTGEAATKHALAIHKASTGSDFPQRLSLREKIILCDEFEKQWRGFFKSGRYRLSEHFSGLHQFIDFMNYGLLRDSK